MTEHSCCNHGLSRRDFLHASAAGAALGLVGCNRKQAVQPVGSSNNEPTLKIGYLPITDATPLLIGHSQGLFESEGLVVDKPVLVRGWPEISEGFLSGSFNLVHLLMPIPIFMRFSQNHRVKVVAWNHMNGSAITVGTKSGVRSLEELGGKNIAIPHWYSMHNVLLQMCLRKYGLQAVVQDKQLALTKSQTNLIVMKPPDMPTAMAGGSIDGYIVAEPFNAAGETLAGGSILRFTGDIFKNHPCCVAVMHEKDIEQHPEWAQRVLNGLVAAQKWTIDNREKAAEVLSKSGGGYLPMEAPVIKRAMSKYDLETYGLTSGTGAIRHPDWNVNRIGFQPFPFESTTIEIVKLLKQTRIEGDSSFLRNLEPESVVGDLFNYDLVKSAAKKAGGLELFEGVDASNPFIRTEVIDV